MTMVEKRSDMVIRQVRKVIRKRRRKICPAKRAAQPEPPAALQRLFGRCREVFHGPGTVPTPEDVQSLCRILDGMKPADLRLSNDAVKGISRVTYTTIYACDKFSLCLMFLPQGGVIPLHNHPGMTVFSKLLLGTMHIKSYDWVHPPNSDDHHHIHPSCSHLRLARLKANREFTAPCDTSVLYPTSGGNIHAFTAVTPCIVLDVLGPPYSADDGRDCTYYQCFPCPSHLSNGGNVKAEKDGGEGYGWLEEIEMPEDAEMDVIEYLGPQITEPSC